MPDERPTLRRRPRLLRPGTKRRVELPPPEPQGITPYVLRWLDDPDGGGVFTSQRDAIRAHDQTCPSLAHPWLPRRKGVSCLSDMMECQECGVTFFWEGLRVAFEDCRWSNHWYCVCCLAKVTGCGCSADGT
jgi:hypothetical protein